MKREKAEEKQPGENNTMEDASIDNETQRPENETEPQDKRQDKSEEQEEESKEEIEAEISELEKTRNELAEAKDKYIRLYSEFENFRRRTAKERLELIKTANEDLVQALLPVIDDFERAQKAASENEELSSVADGYQLIYNKLFKALEQKGLKLMEVDKGSEFNPEFHDAITQIPAPEEELKGKVVDVIEKGYYLGDKVIRFAKVVIGS